MVFNVHWKLDSKLQLQLQHKSEIDAKSVKKNIFFENSQNGNTFDMIFDSVLLQKILCS